MTKERLLEAIGKFDPDGNGVERVKKALEEGRLIPGDACKCLLAEAWNVCQIGRKVGSATLYKGASVLDDEEAPRHECNDVINWFDFSEEAEEQLKEWLL